MDSGLAATRQSGMTRLLRHGHKLEHVAVGIAEIDAAAAVPVVELAVVEAPRRAAENDLGFFNAAKDGVELGLADMKRVVMALELGIVIEQQRQCLVDPHRREIAAAPALQSEKASKEFGRRDFVACRYDGMVEHDGHRCLAN